MTKTTPQFVNKGRILAVRLEQEDYDYLAQCCCDDGYEKNISMYLRSILRKYFLIIRKKEKIKESKELKNIIITDDPI